MSVTRYCTSLPPPPSLAHLLFNISSYGFLQQILLSGDEAALTSNECLSEPISQDRTRDEDEAGGRTEAGADLSEGGVL